ncbi:hypothetical protein [Methylobacterium sp. Leaf117]|uniref:hypothetical protein n=1 Tax=Methylobacterium sp. Leaf117 TaxID=1736260 RepID=UPI0006F8F6B2|nr:hypothetical protein [Methylobacterium sp. Leaf117]KQP82635.1 hypothetical protein ASF57_10685 [Methylobacterium sp. Leaf117]
MNDVYTIGIQNTKIVETAGASTATVIGLGGRDMLGGDIENLSIQGISIGKAHPQTFGGRLDNAGLSRALA